MAREAFRLVIPIEVDGSLEQLFREWRHEQQLKACGKSSLRDCVQSDYLPLRAHFENLIGESDRALETHLRASSEPARIAMMKLRAACSEAGLDLAYPAKICRTQYKCDLDEANAKQLWRLVFTVRNRKKKRTTDHTDSEEPF